MPYFTKDNKTMEVAKNEVMESEEEHIFDRLQKKHKAPQKENKAKEKKPKK